MRATGWSGERVRDAGRASVRTTAAALSGLVAGEREVRITSLSRGDEIGDLARAAAAFRDALERTRRMEEEKEEGGPPTCEREEQECGGAWLHGAVRHGVERRGVVRAGCES